MSERTEVSDVKKSDFTALLCAGQIRQGDIIVCEYNGNIEQYTAEEVLDPGTGREEIIINTKENKYFITSMALKGESWAKNVHVARRLANIGDQVTCQCELPVPYTITMTLTTALSVAEVNEDLLSDSPMWQLKSA